MSKKEGKIKQDSALSLSVMDVSPILKQIYQPLRKKKDRKRFGKIVELLDTKKGNR